MAKVRRVVSGQEPTGKSGIVSDELVEPIEIAPGMHVLPMWGSDELPRFPQSGTHPGFRNFLPGVGGYRFFIFSISANTIAARASKMSPLSDEVVARMGANVGRTLEKNGRGMHTTDTVDLEIVLEGEVGLEFDDGKQIFLSAGDFFVQNGARYRWFNQGPVTAVIACVMIGGHPRD